MAMEKKKAKDLLNRDDKELLQDQEQLRKELFDLRFKTMGEENPSPSRIRQTRREIARIKTVLSLRANKESK